MAAAHVASCPCRATVVGLIVGLAIALAVTAGQSDASDTQSGAIADSVRPNPLLSIDRNRATVVERIVATWGDALAQSGANLDKEQFATLLRGLRSDQLLAASLAGSLEGLRDVVANSLTTTAPVPARLIQDKALGDPDADLVYTPVAPCRIVDTRIAGGTFGAGETRNYHAYSAGGFTAQGGTGNNCAIPAYPSAVVLDTTVIAAPSGAHRAVKGSLTAWPYGAFQPSAQTLPYTSGQTITLDAIVPVCHPSCAEEFSVNASAADVVMDVVGYFRPATGGGGAAGGVTGSGSTNWLAKWSSTTSLVTSNVYEENGNVGIGGFTPVNRLQIGSTPGFSGNDIAIGNGAKGMSFFQTNPASIWYTTADAFALMPNAGAKGRVGIGTTTPDNKLQIGSVGASGFGGNDVAFGDGTHASALAQTPSVAWWYSTTGIAFMPGGGKVGVNTVAPRAPLEVDGYVPLHAATANPDSVHDNFAYLGLTGFNADQVKTDVCKQCAANVSILASNNVMALEFDAASDERLKDVVGQSDPAADLDTINGLRVSDYTLKDKVRYGDHRYKKLIAQQVEAVYPQVVAQHVDYIPNVYQAADARRNGGGGYLLRFSGDHHLNASAKRLKLLNPADGTIVRADIVAIASKSEVSIDAQRSIGERVFVYGEEVDDFRTIDYEGLTALNISATQELAKRVSREQAEIDKLHVDNETEVAELRRQLAEQKLRVASLESQVSELSALKEDLASLRMETEAVKREVTLRTSPPSSRAVSLAAGKI